MIALFVLKEEAGFCRAQALGRCTAEYCAMAGRAAPQAAVKKRPLGQPYFPGEAGLHLSLSHSGGLWCCALAPNPVGVDVERRRPVRVRALSARFFHPEEDALLLTHGDEPALFFDLWTGKEAALKRLGLGLGFGLPSFSAAGERALGGWLRRFDALAGYSLCLCSQTSPNEEECRLIVRI